MLAFTMLTSLVTGLGVGHRARRSGLAASGFRNAERGKRQFAREPRQEPAALALMVSETACCGWWWLKVRCWRRWGWHSGWPRPLRRHASSASAVRRESHRSAGVRGRLAAAARGCRRGQFRTGPAGGAGGPDGGIAERITVAEYNCAWESGHHRELRAGIPAGIRTVGDGAGLRRVPTAI